MRAKKNPAAPAAENPSTQTAVLEIDQEAVTRKPDVRLVRVDDIRPSPFQRRKTFNGLDELAASIAKAGILQPLLVRARAPVGPQEHFELVFGERRLRAARQLGVDEVPVQVRAMDDAAVIEALVIENVQRQDVSQLEEAESYRDLMEQCGLTIEDVVKRTGKGRSTVYQRLRLLELDEKGREALETGALSPSVAALVVQVTDPKLRAQFQKWCLADRSWDGKGEPVSYRAAADELRREYSTALSEAPWVLEDAELHPVAGPCSVCPKRSSAQGVLFEGREKGDVCLDTKCFGVKRQLHGELLVAAAKAAGRQVVKTKDVSASHLLHDAGYVLPSDSHYGGGRSGTWEKLLGKKSMPELVVVQDKHGNVVEAIPKKAAEAALRKKDRESGRVSEKERAEKKASTASQKKHVEVARWRRHGAVCALANVAERASAEVVAGHLPAETPGAAVLRVLCADAFRMDLDGDLLEIAAELGVKVDLPAEGRRQRTTGVEIERKFVEALAPLNGAQLFALFVATTSLAKDLWTLDRPGKPSKRDGADCPSLAIAATLGLDLAKTIEKEAKVAKQDAEREAAQAKVAAELDKTPATPKGKKAGGRKAGGKKKPAAAKRDAPVDDGEGDPPDENDAQIDELEQRIETLSARVAARGSRLKAAGAKAAAMARDDRHREGVDVGLRRGASML